MGPTLTKPVLVYDGECTFCRWCVRFLVRRTRRPLTCVAYQDADVAALGLTLAQCAAAVQWVGQNGSVSEAHKAVAAALRNARIPWPILGVVIDAPGLRRISAYAYRRVAMQRRCAAPTPPVE